MVRKTVMLAGAAGSDLNPRRRGAGLPALEAVANRPIVQHALDSVLGVCGGGVVFVGDADALMDLRGAVADQVEGVVGIDYAVCPLTTDLGAIARAALPFVDGAPCLIWPANGLYDGDVRQLLDALEPDATDLTVLVNASGDSADVGLLGPGVLSDVADQLTAEGGGDIAAAARHLAGLGMSIDWCPVDGWRRYSGHGTDLLELNRIALDRQEADVPARMRAVNRIEGRVVIDPSADVQSSVLIGPAVVGREARVRDAYIGPYTAVGAHARIEGAEVERSIVSPGASVMHVGSRLVSSLVGRDSRVFRDFALPRALRLWVGEGDDVALC